jgi:hypothetical protein
MMNDFLLEAIRDARQRREQADRELPLLAARHEPECEQDAASA